MVNMMYKRRAIALLGAVFLLTINIAIVDAAGVKTTTQARTTAVKDTMQTGTQVTAAKSASAAIEQQTQKAATQAKADAATVQARMGAAAEDAPTKILNLTKRIGAARGSLVNDAQAALTTAPTEADKDAARAAFFAKVREVFAVKGLNTSDTGYRLARFQLQLFLRLISGQATAQDLSNIAIVIIRNPAAPEFAIGYVDAYMNNDLLMAADKILVQGWLANGYNNDATYFSSQNCQPPAGVVVSAAASTQVTSAKAPAPAPKAPAPTKVPPGVKVGASGR